MRVSGSLYWAPSCPITLWGQLRVTAPTPYSHPRGLGAVLPAPSCSLLYFGTLSSLQQQGD